ncbi:uncharacterized protein LOC135937298 isoform X2 [Cloeon dipterum]|uniref:uncharacterized protein LOC135937298 isoform X2 n=1 Tax=Cloeon dipterum TaxID=197152 RepID=UPI0032203E0E
MEILKILVFSALLISTATGSTESKRLNYWLYCRNYNLVKKNLLDSATAADFIIGKRDSEVELLDNRDRAVGTFVKKGYKILFSSLEKAKYDKAVKTCVYRNMQLLALERPEEINEIYLSSIYKSNADESHEDLEFLWTSAAPCSKSDPLDAKTKSCSSVTWCSNDVATRLDYTLYLGRFSPPYCMIYRRSSRQLEPTNCTLEASFFCETPCSKPKCPLPDECIKDDSLFTVTKGKSYLKSGNKFGGKWIRSNNNISYFLGEKQVDWSENWKTCCSLGLKPIALTDNLTNQFDREDSPMQGLVYWTAMTRADCPYEFENCFHSNATEPFSIPTIHGVFQEGSCVAVTVRDPSAKLYLGYRIAVKTTPCISKLLLACEGPVQTFRMKKKKKTNCKVPDCTGIAECVMDDSNFLTQPFRVLLVPQRFGNWTISCSHSFLELPNEYGTWDEAYTRCCSLGMDLLSFQNPIKQHCLANPPKALKPPEGQFWTSGRDLNACRGKLRWCTGYLNDFLKKDLIWKAGEDPDSANNSCVFIDLSKPKMSSLALAECSEKKQILCEAPAGVGYKLQVPALFCRKIYMVKEAEAYTLWNSGDLSRAGSGAKKMIQCLAEFAGLFYSSTKLNKQTYLNMVSKIITSTIDLQKMFTIMTNKRDWFRAYKETYGEQKVQNMIEDMSKNTMEDFYLEPFQLGTELINKLDDCSAIPESGEATFAFGFVQCLLQSKELQRFWKAYSYQSDQFSVIPAQDEISSPCLKLQNYLQNTFLCIPPAILAQLGDSGPFISGVPINVQKLNTSSYTACLERRGSLPYAETKEMFFQLYSFFRSVAPNLTIIWDQAFFSSNDRVLAWCRSGLNPFNPSDRVAVPIAVKGAATTKEPLMLISLPGPKPNLRAVSATEELLYQTDVFCRFPQPVVTECTANNSLPEWAYWRY